jgi:hypothetical protein
MTGKTGPGHPPAASRFRKGQSGNPKGRPRAAKAKTNSAFDIVIDRTLTVTRSGVAGEVTVEEALQHQTYRAAIAGNRPARREILKMIAKREQVLAASVGKQKAKITVVSETTDPANADAAMLILGIASRNPERQGPGFDGDQLLLEPWAVQLALSRRRGGEKLTDKEISEIRRCTRDASTLRWPRNTNE